MNYYESEVNSLCTNYYRESYKSLFPLNTTVRERFETDSG
jgi:hypothetical protein